MTGPQRCHYLTHERSPCAPAIIACIHTEYKSRALTHHGRRHAGFILQDAAIACSIIHIAIVLQLSQLLQLLQCSDSVASMTCSTTYSIIIVICYRSRHGDQPITSMIKQQAAHVGRLVGLWLDLTISAGSTSTWYVSIKVLGYHLCLFCLDFYYCIPFQFSSASTALPALPALTVLVVLLHSTEYSRLRIRHYVCCILHPSAQPSRPSYWPPGRTCIQARNFLSIKKKLIRFFNFQFFTFRPKSEVKSHFSPRKSLFLKKFSACVPSEYSTRNSFRSLFRVAWLGISAFMGFSLITCRIR